MEKTKTFQQIAKWLVLATVAMTSLLVVRTFDLQGLHGEEFFQKSEENRLFRWEIPAERGVLLDRYGKPLVRNVKQYFKVAPDQLYSDRTYVSRDEALKLMVEHPDQVGYELEREYLYPFPLAHVLGYVGSVDVEDLEADRTLRLSDTLGKMGLEKKYDALLRGVAGFQEFEIDALGKRQNKSVVVKSRAGSNLQTSLDAELTVVAWKALGEKKGAVVILNPKTGEVLSLISTPSFDSNLLGQHRLLDDFAKEEVRKMFKDDDLRFFNRAVAGTYPPGSVFKLVTVLAGLESGAFNQNMVVEDNGFIEVGGSRFANWYYTQYGRTEGAISLVRAIIRSNDIYFYKAAELTGVDRLVSLAERMGLGSVTGIELAGEQPGLVPSPTWKERVLGERWFLGNTFHMGIGQGDLLVTPLQQAQMIGTIINFGELCKPSLLGSEDGADGGRGGDCAGMGFSRENLELVMQGMVGACSAGGTAYPFFNWNSLMGGGEREGAEEGDVEVSVESAYDKLNRGFVACKTGTAEFGSKDEKGYRKTQAWFGMGVGGLKELRRLAVEEKIGGESAKIAIEKAENFPDKIVIVVLVESDDEEPFREGSRDAAPIAKEILDWVVSGEASASGELVR